MGNYAGWTYDDDGRAFDADGRRVFEEYGPVNGKESGSWQEGKPKFKLSRVSDLIANPKPVPWVIKRLVEECGVHLMFGAYGTGKSFCAFDMGFCVANGLEWLGRKVAKKPVVILCGEGHSAIGHRFDALARHYGIACPENIFVSEIPARFTDTQFTAFVLDALNEVAPGAFVLIDTLNRNFGAGDENSTKDMTSFMGNIDQFLRGTGKTVLIIHHSGHADKDRGRGNSSLPSACEGEFKITATDGGLVCEVIRLKNAENKKEKFEFKYKKVDLGFYDDEGEEVCSLVIEHIGECKKPTPKETLNAIDIDILDSLYDAIDRHGVPPSLKIKDKFAGFKGYGGQGKRVVHIEYWREYAYKRIVVDGCPKENQQEENARIALNRRQAFARSRERLIKSKKTIIYDDFVWIL